MLTNHDRNIIKTVRYMPKSKIETLSNHYRGLYMAALVNALDHVCKKDAAMCSGKCRHVNQCNLIVNLLCRIKPNRHIAS